VDFVLQNIFIIAVAVVSGAMLMWPGFSRARGVNGVDTTGATQLVNHEQAVFVDIRPPVEYEKGHIAQARNVPVDDIETRASSLPKNKPLIVVCNNGRTAARAAAQFKAKGFEKVHTLNGGLIAWQQAGLPVTTR